MPDESDLKDMFANASAPNTLNADRIIAKSRARRVQKQVGAGLVGALAVAGIFVVAINTTQFTQPPATVSMESQESGAGSAADSGMAVKRAPAEKLNLCGGTLAEVAPSAYGLQLDVVVPMTAPVGTEPVDATVTLTNTSDQRVAGTTAAVPAITISQGGVVKWHSNGPMIMSLVIVDLEPGQSLEYATSITPVLCDVEDDTAQVFRSDLPPLDAGDYELSAAIDFTIDQSLALTDIPDLDLVTGPRSPFTLTQ